MEDEEKPMVFSDALEATLSQVLPTDDPMESASFSVVDYVNKMFPNEQSLVNIEVAETKLKQQIRKLDEEILDAVREQTQSGAKGRQDLVDAKQAIGQLGTRIREIKEQAEQSETMVQEICRDIKSLDYAKKNLTTGITSLKRLHMLVSGVEQLQEMTQRRQFREAASMLEAVQQLKEHFRPYSNLEKIRELEARIAAAQQGLKKKVMEEFENMHEQRHLQAQDPSHSLGSHSVLLDHLADACLAAEALGKDVRDDVIKMFYTPYLVEYRTNFRTSTEAGRLEGTVRRYSWLRKQLRQYDDEYSRIFPASWSVAELFCAEFCRVTRNDLQAALDEATARENLDVPALLNALNKTIEFEKELTLRFRREQQQIVMGDEEEDVLSESESDSSEDDDIEPPDQTSAAYIKWKYKRHAKLKRKDERQQKREELARRMEERQKQLVESGADVQGFKFAGAISQAFEQYLHLYLDVEDKAMKELVDRVTKENDTAQLRDDVAAATAKDGDGAGRRVGVTGLKVLPSSTQLFLHFKKSLGRCRAITTGQTLFGLFRLFQKYLGIYCDQLNARIPKASSAGVSLAMALAKGMDPTKDGIGSRDGALVGRSRSTSGGPESFQRISLTDEDEATICMVINTAEYCFQTLEQLDSSVRKMIDEPFKDDIDLSAQQDQFSGTIAQGAKALVQGLETKIEPALVSFAKMPWGTWESVGDQSEYVNSIHVALSQTVPLIGSLLSKAYFRYFCDKFAASFIPRFVGAIYRCKRISEVGASQILLDAQALKTVMLDVPAMGLAPKGVSSDDALNADELASTEKAASAGYIRFVNKEMGRAELILKVICTPPESLMDSYEALIPDGTEADFVRIMELKGMKKTDQERFMESFVKGGKNLKKLFSLS